MSAPVTFKAGTPLIREGELSQKMFIIHKGKVRVFKDYMGKMITLAVLGEGEVFGELSFFDAEPRSASVVALTDMEAIVIESRNAEQQIGGLPPWVMTILRATFKRFRDADHRIMLLQSMNAYQKKVFKSDSVGKTVFLELLRFIKAFRLICDAEARKGPLHVNAVYQELDEILGPKMLNLRMFWQRLHDHGMIEHVGTSVNKDVQFSIHGSNLQAFTDYVSAEVQTERFLILEHTAVAILRRLVSVMDEENAGQASTPQRIPFTAIESKSMAFFDVAIEELKKHGIVQTRNEEFLVEPSAVATHYVYQDILRSFDHTTMSVG